MLVPGLNYKFESLVRSFGCESNCLLPGGVYQRDGGGRPGSRLCLQEGEDSTYPYCPYQHARV